MPPSEPWPWSARPSGLRIGFCDHSALTPAAPPPHLRHAVRRRQLDFAAGRQAARDALCALNGQSAPVGRSASGAPLWPPGVTGAISHAGGRAVALVGHAALWVGLGVDLDTITAQPQDIARVTLTPAERAWLTPTDARRVTLAFCAKEALFKALYPTVQRLFGFDAAELTALHPGYGSLRLRVSLPPWPQGARFGFLWTQSGDQLLTAVLIAQPRRVAPPSTYRSAMVT